MSNEVSQSESQIELLEQLIQRLRAGLPNGVAWREMSGEFRDAELKGEIARVLRLSGSLGSPAVPALERLVQTQLQRIDASQELQAEFVAPKATARLVAWLPVLFFVLAQLLGLPVLQSVMVSAVSKVAVVLGCGLLLVARVWSRRILAGAQRSPSNLASTLDHLVIALNAGLSLDAAMKRIDAPPEVLNLLVQERMLARQTGAPVAMLITARADRIRANQARDDKVRVREASIKLMMPLGATVLPALILLLVVPLAVGFTSGPLV